MALYLPINNEKRCFQSGLDFLGADAGGGALFNLYSKEKYERILPLSSGIVCASRPVNRFVVLIGGLPSL
jgi:hypothetical protein